MNTPGSTIHILTAATDLTVFIARDGDKFLIDTRALALAFNKQHQHIMRTIHGMLANVHPEIAAHGRSNFGLSSYVTVQGKTKPMYRMTADGLSELAMSFTGDEARIIRIRFLAAFREVARRLDSAEQSITQMLHEHTKRAAASEAKGSLGSMLMHGRRKAKPSLETEKLKLLELSQPRLPLE